jgi:hypothetical protein
MRQPSKTLAPLHITQDDGTDPATAEYGISFGGSNDELGTVLLAKRKGLVELRAYLESLSIASCEVETACRVLTEQPRYEVRVVTLSRATLPLRSLRG